MTNPGSDDREPPSVVVEPVPTTGRRRTAAVLVGAVAATSLIVALVVGPSLLGAPGPSLGALGDAGPATTRPAASGAASPAPATDTPPAASGAAPTPAATAAIPGPPGEGRIAIVARDGTLSVVDDRGGPLLDLGVAGVGFGPPAWSRDGTRLAAIGSGPDGAGIHVFDLAAGAAEPPEPRVVYESLDRAPFYLSWSPDGERLGFLANADPSTITLRAAFADGAPATDGPGGDGVVWTGSPLYFDWPGDARLLLHVGFGAEAFTGQVDLAGDRRADGLDGSGDFRTAVARADGEALAYVRGSAPDGTVVIADRDGTSRHELAVSGPAALAFDPQGDALAVLAADALLEDPLPFPFGPLRLVGDDGGVTTLIEGPVAAFYWSPDGSTIAAVRVVDDGGSSNAAVPRVALAPARATPAVEDPEPSLEIHVTFVDVAAGDVRSDRVVRLGGGYVSTVLPYFDQYALSHRVWAPDGSAIVLPLEDADGIATLMVLGVDGDDRAIAEGIHASWAP